MFSSLIVIAAVAIIIFGLGLKTKVWLYAYVLRGFNFAGIPFLFLGLRAGNRSAELTEYRDNGTIDGIKASQIFDDPFCPLDASFLCNQSA